MKLPDDFDSAAAKVAGSLSTDPIDRAASEVVAAQKVQAKTSLYSALLQSPEMAARAQKLGRRTGLPADVVSRNLPEVERSAYLSDIDAMLDANPAVVQFLTSPQYAAMAHDDVENMGQVERKLRQFGGGATEGVGMAVSGTGRIMDIVQRNVLQGLSSILLPTPKAGPMGITPQAPSAESLTGPMIGDGWRELGGTIKDFARKELMIPQAAQTFGDKVAAGLGQVAGQVAMFPLDRGASMFAQGADVMGEKVDKDPASQGRKDLAVLGGAAVTGITERWALDKLLGPLAVPVKNQIGAAMARIGIASASEGAQEFTENVLQDTLRKALTNRDAEINIGQSIEEGGVGAAVGGIVRTIVEGALHIRVRGAQAQVAQQDAQAITELTQLAQASKLAQRDPATFQEFVRQAAQDGPVQEVYIDAKTFAQAAQSAGLQPEQLPASVREQLGDALATGGSVRIPIEEYAAQIATTEYAQGLIDHLKTDPLGMSRAEAQVFMQSQLGDLQASVEKALAERESDASFKAEIDQVRAGFTEQLAQANRFTPDVNTAYANMLANFYAVTAAKAGMTPQQLVERYPIKVQAEGVQGAAAQYDQAGQLKTDTPEFKTWFGESKVTDGQGKPLVVYHGTAKAFDRFDANKTMDGVFWFTSDKTKLERGEAGAAARGDLMPVYLSAKNLAGWDQYEKFSIDELIAQGYDGIQLDDDYVIFEPTQIKSVNNTGTFSSTDPNIFNQAKTAERDLMVTHNLSADNLLHAAKIGEFDNLFFQGNRGQIAFGQDITQVPSIITLLKGADLSTFLHESGHFFLEVQFDLASRVAGEAAMFGSDTNNEAQRQLLNDTSELLRWFGLSSIEEWYALPMEQKRSYHEQFARGFEAYLFEGKAPSIELQGLFQRFRAWLMRVYRDLKALNVELTDEVRGVMDRMLATTEQIQLAEQGRSMMPLFTAPEQAGMSVEEFAAYQDLGTQASQDAIEELQTRTLRDMQWMERAKGREIKRLKRESADRRAEMTIEARREVMSQPVYRAWQFLTGKLSKDDKAAMTPEAAPKSTSGPVDPSVDSLFVAIVKLGGLDRGQVQSQWGWDAKERSPQPMFGKPLLRRENGVSLDAMGELLAEYGYLPKDENGKFDARDLEDKFQAEYRGDAQFSVEYEYARAVRGEQRPGEGTDLENLGAGRFDLVALKDIGLPEQAVQIMVDLKMTAKDGIHPDLVAEAFGFTSGDELVRTLAVAEAPKVAIEQLTDQKMLEKYGELATPEAIERAAEQAIHNDTRARFVATELNALAKATGQPKVLASAAREMAKTMIERLLVRNVKPTQYAAAEVRAAKAAEQAVKSGDTETAAAEKRNQLINTYATRSAINALADVEQGLRYLGKFGNDGTRKAIDVDYLDQIDTILERFDLRTGQSLRSIDRRKSLAKWMAEQEELGIEVDLPEKLTAEAFRQSYKDMTIEEFRGLVDSVKQIEHLGRLKETLLTAADNRRFADVVGEITRSVEENADGREVNNRTRDTLGNRAINFFKGVLAEHRKVASLARELDGFKDAGPVWRYLIDSMNTSGDREASMRAEATARLAEMVKPVLAQGRMGGKGKFFASLGMSLNRSEQLAIALNLGNEGNTQRLLDGKGWTLEQVLPVMRNLTAADWQFVQQVWDFFESYRPQIGAMERRISGKEPAWVEPRPLTVQTKDGQEVQLRGGYYPIVYDPAESGRAEQFADAEAAKQMMKGAFVASTTRSSFIKGRTEKVTGRPVMLTWDALFQGANDVIHRLAWQEWVIDANRLIKNDSVDEAIRTGYGAETVKQFKNAIRDIAAGENAQVDTLSKGLNYVRSGAAVAGLGLNLMNAMLQPLGLSQSMVRVGTKWVAMGAAEWAKSPVGLVRQVHEKSEFMRNRSRTQQRELNEIRSVVQGKSEVQQKLDAIMFMPMTSLQLIADMPTWWGAYQKALAQAPVDMDAELAEERAVKLADQSVIDAQGGGQTKDLAAVQRSQLLKLFTVFYGYFSTTYNLGVERAKATNFRSPLEVMHLAWDYLLLFSAPAVLATIMKSALTPGGEDDDPEKLAKKLASEQISYLMGMMIGVREATSFVQGITGTSQYGGGYSGPAGLRFFSDLGKLGKQVSQGELDEALRRSLVNVGGVLLHLPSGQVNKTLDGINALNEGKTDNPAALLFGVER